MIQKTDFEKYFETRGEFKDLDLTLDRIKSALDETCMGDDIAKNVIHIAGTNGKGSTAFFIEQILAHRGFSTALFTSPHITSITERIRLCGKEITVSDFNAVFDDIRPYADKHKLSYFETLTLIAFKYYKNAMPDYAIIETGLGGRLDSTNVLDRKTPVITSISKDHVEFLGSDLLKIADEKLAIIKNNLLVFIGDNTEYMNKYLDYKLHSKTIVRAGYSQEAYHSFEQPFANNLKLAEAVCDYFTTGTMPADLRLPPCRNERIGSFILDGGHNEDALEKLAQKYKDSSPVVVFSSTRDRDTAALLGIVSGFASHIVLTNIPGNDRSIDINSIDTNHIKEKDLRQALKIAVELSENADILVCGSLYLCAEAREILSKGMM